MKLLPILLTIIILVLAGCQTQTQQQEELTLEDMMANMPCHRMPDGSLMGNCDEDQLAQDDLQSHMYEDSTGDDDHADEDVMFAKSSSIVDVANGETFHIESSIVKKNIAGKEIEMYAYNGMVPGPAIRVEQNSTITVEFTNHIGAPTTIHWHGLRHDVKDDGVPGISQPPVQPGETYTYTLYFPDDGIYWYHPHIREDIQQDKGLYGNILVRPQEPYNDVNAEELLIFDDILLNDVGNVAYGVTHANFAVMGRFGNTLLINGNEDYSLTVNKGDVVRFYLTNVANVRPYNISIPGAQIKRVGGDLGLYEQEEYVDSIIIAPAERYIIEVYFPEAGDYSIMNINPHETYDMGSITVTEQSSSESFVDVFETLQTRASVQEDIAQFEQYFDKPVDYQIDLTIEMSMMQGAPCHFMMGMVMGDCTAEERESLQEQYGLHNEGDFTIEWEDEMNMNMPGNMVKWILEDAESKKQNMDIDFTFKQGDIIKIKLFNDPNSVHPMQHPIHLHGQRFLVLTVDGELVENKVWKDTVLVPIGSTVEILVDVTNPGEWMMHCHIAEHLEAGMMATFTVEE